MNRHSHLRRGKDSLQIYPYARNGVASPRPYIPVVSWHGTIALERVRKIDKLKPLLAVVVDDFFNRPYVGVMKRWMLQQFVDRNVSIWLDVQSALVTTVGQQPVHRPCDPPL
jgi:hypothetical protein